MRDRSRRPVGVLAVGAVVVAFMLTLGGCGGHRRADGRPGRADAAALTAGREFLDSYVDPDGRVVRRDQGGDTVSEVGCAPMGWHWPGQCSIMRRSAQRWVGC